MDKHQDIVTSHWVAGLLPVICLGLVMWIFDSNSGPKSLRAGNDSQASLNFQGLKPFPAPVTAEAIEEEESYKFHYKKTVTAKVTGYTPGAESCGIFADGLTSIGEDAWALDGVAADPSVLPYGTIVFIPGVGYREVDDTGSAMRNAWKDKRVIHIDLRFAEVKDALKWGVRQLPVHIFLPE